METFSHVTDAICSIEKSTFKDSSSLIQADTNNCVVKAIAVILQVDYTTAYSLCKKYFNRKHGVGVRTSEINQGIVDLLREYGHQMIACFRSFNYSYYGKENQFLIYDKNNCNFGFDFLQFKFYNRKYLTVEQVRRQSANKKFIVIIKRHALVVKDKKIIDYKEGKQRRVYFVYEID